MCITVFAVDDDSIQLEMTAEILRERHGYQVVTALGGRAAIEHFLLRTQPQPDVVLLDLIMPEISGIDVVKAIRLSDPHIPIILLSPRDQHGLVMEAIRAGANDCLQKPANIHYLKMTVEKHVQREQMRAELSRLERYQRSQFCFEDILGRSEAMRRCLHQARDAAAQLLPLLIDGGMGAGKELFARVIHSQSSVGNGRFISIDGGHSHPFMEQLKAQQGRLNDWPSELGRASDGATVFLRHVDEMPMQEQEILAHFLLDKRNQQSAQWDRLRWIAGSCESLAELYRKGQIHEKLYYYFSAQRIALPSLAARGDDVVLLANYYLKRFTATNAFSVQKVDDKAAKLLREKDWSGNVMELINLMQRAAYYAHESTLGTHVLSVLMEHPDMPVVTMMEAAKASNMPQIQGDYKLLTTRGEVKPFDEIEADIIRFAIEHYRGKMTEVARKLGIGRSTLYRKMQDYKLREEVA